MRNFPLLCAVTAPLILAACSANPPTPAASVAFTSGYPVTKIQAVHRDTILLVSLDDGSVIKQSIDVGADICFKQNSSSATTCLTQGAPIIDPGSDTIIGYEMIEAHIDLVARSD